jgi:hypothetical protein
LFELLQWLDLGMHVTAAKADPKDGKVSWRARCRACLDKDGDGNVSVLEALYNVGSSVLYSGTSVLFLATLFLFGPILVAATTTLAVAAAFIALYLVRDWSGNDFYLSAAAKTAVRRVLVVGVAIAFFSAVFTAGQQRLYSASVLFLLLIGHEVSAVASRVAELRGADPDAPFLFSPAVVPVYVYQARESYVVDETATALRALGVLLLGVTWGVTVAAFSESGPRVGVGLTALFLLATCVAAALAVSHTQTTITRNAARFADARMVAEAAGCARKTYKASPPTIKQKLENEKIETILRFFLKGRRNRTHMQPSNLSTYLFSKKKKA